jgi:hypothetical protein
MPEDLKSYIQKELGKGFAREDIKKELVQTGYKEEDVKAAMDALPITPAVADRFRPAAFFDTRYMMFTGIALLIIAAGIAAFFMLTGDAGPVEQPIIQTDWPTVKPPKEDVSQVYMDCVYMAEYRQEMCTAWLIADSINCTNLVDLDVFGCEATAAAKKGLNGDCALQGDAQAVCIAARDKSVTGCTGITDSKRREYCTFFGSINGKQDQSICESLAGIEKEICDAMTKGVCNFTEKDCVQ